MPTGADARSAATILPVQYLRGAAAFAVFLFHVSALAHATWGPDLIRVDHVGAAGVDLFFVISGFVMAMVVARRPVFDMRDFVFKRMARVLPSYWLVTIGVFVLALVAPMAMQTTAAEFDRLLLSLVFVPWPDANGSMAPLLLVGWTLNYEIFFYALVALMVGFFADRALLRTVVVLAALVLAGGILAPVHPTLAFYTDPILLEFGFGILVWHLHSSLAQEKHSALSAALLVIGVALLVVQFERDPGAWRAALWGIPVALILFGSLRMMRFSSPSLAALGDWSYALYLTHLFVVAGYMRIVMPHVPDVGLWWQFHYFAITVISLSVAALFHKLVERPANRWLSAHLTWHSRPRTPLVAAE